jgi:hypothetical protein
MKKLNISRRNRKILIYRILIRLEILPGYKRLHLKKELTISKILSIDIEEDEAKHIIIMTISLSRSLRCLRKAIEPLNSNLKISKFRVQDLVIATSMKKIQITVSK